MDLQLVQTVTNAAFMIFLLVMVVIDVYSWRKTKTIEGFLLRRK